MDYLIAEKMRRLKMQHLFIVVWRQKTISTCLLVYLNYPYLYIWTKNVPLSTESLSSVMPGSAMLPLVLPCGTYKYTRDPSRPHESLAIWLNFLHYLVFLNFYNNNSFYQSLQFEKNSYNKEICISWLNQAANPLY